MSWKDFCSKHIFGIVMGILMLVHKSECVLEFTMESSVPTEYLLLPSETPVTLRCIHEFDKTVNMLLRHKEKDSLIVDNSVFDTQVWPNYQYSIDGSQHDLTIENVSSSFNGYIYLCVGRPSARTLSLRLVVVGPPECNFNIQEPIFFTDDLGDSFQMTCELETDHPAIDMGITNSLLGHQEVDKTHNDTHNIVSLKKEINTSWNGSFFYCILTLNGADKSEHEGSGSQHACHYGPLQFHEQLLVEKPVQNSTYYEGDRVTFTCKSNIPSAKKEWLDVKVPDKLKYYQFETGNSISLHIKSVPDTSDIYLITVKCKASFGRKYSVQEFHALVYGNSLPLPGYILWIVVTLFVLFLPAVLEHGFPHPGRHLDNA